MKNPRRYIDMAYLQQGDRIIDQLVVLRADEDILYNLNILIKQQIVVYIRKWQTDMIM